ncbi:MAG: zinc metalloprotease HtpX [Planctomycetes bacterium]|nr:zinc metalloprotease HtpX [Planctomycetota bacterium]
MKNQLKTILLLGILSVLLVAIGGAIGRTGLYVFLGLALVMNLGAYLFSDRLILRMNGARLVTPEQAPALHRMVSELAAKANMPVPRLAVIADPTPNAFATGRSPERGVVAVTEGILQLLDPRELRGVIAHELAHIKNRDTLVATVAAMLATVITYVANVVQWGALFGGHQQSEEGEGGGAGGGLLMALLAPIAATMVQMGISRSREYLADETAARLTGDPLALGSALVKLQRLGEAMADQHQPQPASASLYIVNPLAGRSLLKLFSTHPPIEDRVARLEEIAADLGVRRFAS